MPSRQIPAYLLNHSLLQYDSDSDCGNATIHDLSNLHKAGITLNPKLPKSGNSYMRKDKHSANATEPWMSSRHQKNTCKDRISENSDCFILTMWSGFLCGEAAQRDLFM